jgi:hypothetical protein
MRAILDPAYLAAMARRGALPSAGMTGWKVNKRVGRTRPSASISPGVSREAAPGLGLGKPPAIIDAS